MPNKTPYGSLSITSFFSSFPTALLFGYLFQHSGDYYGVGSVFTGIFTFFGLIILGLVFAYTGKYRNETPPDKWKLGLWLNWLALLIPILLYLSA